MGRLQSDPEHRGRLSRRASAAFRERWVESAVIPRYLNVVRETAVRRGREDIAAALSLTETT